MSLSTLKITGRRDIFLVISCLLIAFALRFYTFDQKSLWLDEVHTFNDSRDDFRAQLRFYKENPTFLHPPLFFMLTHQFYPFTKPERDLRIIPLIFGTLSIPMIYLLARLFSPSIAFPCALSLTFMAYHISLTQDGRSYALLLFLGMSGLYFFMKHLKTSKKRYLILVALFFSTLFYTSYSSVPFIVLSQLLWFYRPTEETKKPTLSSFFILNGLIPLFCLPWIIFVGVNYKGQAIMDPFHTESVDSFWYMLYGVLHDWVSQPPLMILSVILLILFPIFSKSRRNALVLLAVSVLPIGGLYLFCKMLHITHFVTSRYFINFLPFFLITLFLSLDVTEVKLERLRRFIRLKVLFLILFVASNLIILPLYYHSEKQDIRGLVTYLKNELKDGDKIFLEIDALTPGILYYFGAHPTGRHHFYTGSIVSGREVEFRTPFVYRNRTFVIYNYRTCCDQYVADGSRLWIIVGKWTAKKIKGNSPSVLKGYFDGSFLSVRRFPTDASMYLFLWDPSSPEEKGIDIPIE